MDQLVVNIKRHKEAGKKSPMLLNTRSIRHCYWLRSSRPGYSLDGFDLTDQVGVAVLAVQSDDDWHTDMPLALVLNSDDFWMAEYLGEPEPIGAFLHVAPDDIDKVIGWMGNRRRAPVIYLYVNFDSHGLELADKIIGKVAEAEVYLPTSITEAWKVYGRIQDFNPLHFDQIQNRLNLSRQSLQTFAMCLRRFQTGMPLDTLMYLEKADPALA